MQRAAHDGHPGERLGERVLLPVRHGVLQRRVRQRHHVRARFRLELEPAREVHVQDVEAAAAELELSRLHVHDDVVADLDRPRHARIRDAGDAVDLEPHELRMRARRWR